MKISFLYNKYFITLVAFLIILTFFDDNNLITQYKLSKELRNLNEEKQYYLNEIKKNTEIKNSLMSDLENLERFGREEYRMKRDNEDIYIFEYVNKED